jgi:hypothetical protein
MTEIGTSLDIGKAVVAEAGKRVHLEGTADQFTNLTIIIQALGTNEGEIVVGDSTVVAAPGTHAEPKQEGIALAAKATLAIDIIDGAQIWIDATKSGDGISWIALQA